MNNNEELYYPFDKGKFDIRDVCGKFQKLIDEYNDVGVKRYFAPN